MPYYRRNFCNDHVEKTPMAFAAPSWNLRALAVNAVVDENLLARIDEVAGRLPGSPWEMHRLLEFVSSQVPDVPVPRDGELVYAAVRGSCFLRKVFWRMVSSRRRKLSVLRRNQWVGFRPACLLPCRPAGGPT